MRYGDAHTGDESLSKDVHIIQVLTIPQ
jgi:hypothetical protein